MERREVLASNLGAIAGVAFVDQAGDGSLVGDPPVANGTQVELFIDTNANGQFDVGPDLLIGTDFTDANGNFRFDGLTADTYFLVQDTVAGLTTPPPSTVIVSNAMGIQTALIDDYSTTTQSVTATANSTNTDSVTAPEVIGGSRDVQVANVALTGQVTVFVDSAADMLSVGSLGDGVGTALIQYDGPDNSLTLDTNGLGNVSLAGGAANDPMDPGAGLIVLTRAESAGDSLFITVHTDGVGSSTATINIPQDATNFIETFVRFSNFSAGANFNDIGAIEASLTLSANNDAFVSIVEARRPEIVQSNLANIQPIALGGQLFLDNSSVGQNNGLREGTEAGLTGITVDLFQLAGPNDVVDPTTSIPLTSTASGANGTYSFPGLAPGHYAVVVPASQFQTGAALAGLANSTGNDPASDPDDNIDDDDNGTTITGGAVISGTITLESNSEPINDDDNDPNTNTTVDFGFFPQIDLLITKTLNTVSSNVSAGGSAVFDIFVQNAGPLEATNVDVVDVFPAGLTFTGTINPSGSFTTIVNGSTVTVTLGTIAAGATASFQMTSDIDVNQTTDITNMATVSGSEVETDTTNNSDDEVLDLIATDLRIVKTDLSDPVTAGTQLVYQITVTNDGPDDAAGVVVTDPLPTGVTFASGDVDGDSSLVSFDAGTGEVTATVGALVNNANSVITITVNVAGDAASPLSNSATVTANPDTDPNPSNNTSSEDTTVDRLVDVALIKTVTGTPVAGQNVTYTLVITNNGPSQAGGISVADTLDSNLSFVSFDPGTSGVTLSQSGQALTFDVGVLDAAATSTFMFDVSIASSASGTIPNAATVSTTDTDSDSTNDMDSVDIAVQQQVDLMLVKDVDLVTAVPGQDQLVYTITISHDTDSVSDATNVLVTDVLPAGLIGAVISAPTADSTDFTNNTVTVGFNAIPVGETRTFTVTVDIDESATGNVTNPASVASDGTELDPDNNSDDATTAFTPDFDVVVTKSVNNPTPGPTNTVIYTVDLSNSGPSTAIGVLLTDTIPAGLTFVSGTLDGQNGVSDGTTVTFPVITLDANTSRQATLTFTVDADATGTLTNTASIPDLSADGENDITNNSDTSDITVTPLVDLAIAKNVSLTEAQIGSNLTYTIVVTNNGPSQAANVQVVDTLPSGVNFVSGTGPNGETLSENSGIVNVNGGDLDNAGSFSFTIDVNVAAGASGDQINTAVVSSDTNEDDPSNNTATASTTIDPLTSTIGGSVYVDANNNGIFEPSEAPIPGVLITLAGTDSLGNAVNATSTTDASGAYLFATLAQGTYIVTETQPLGFRNGMTTAGTGATANVADNVFSELGLGSDTDAINFNFGELDEPLSKRRFLASS